MSNTFILFNLSLISYQINECIKKNYQKVQKSIYVSESTKKYMYQNFWSKSTKKYVSKSTKKIYVLKSTKKYVPKLY